MSDDTKLKCLMSLVGVDGITLDEARELLGLETVEFKYDEERKEFVNVPKPSPAVEAASAPEKPTTREDRIEANRAALAKEVSETPFRFKASEVEFVEKTETCKGAAYTFDVVGKFSQAELNDMVIRMVMGENYRDGYDYSIKGLEGGNTNVTVTAENRETCESYVINFRKTL